MKRAPRPSLGREFWIEKIIEFKASGLNQTKFAREHSLDVSTLHGWLKRLDREQTVAVKPKKGIIAPRRGKVSPPVFAKVIVGSPSNHQEGLRVNETNIRIAFPGGITLEMGSQADVFAVAQLIRHAGGLT